VLGILIGGHHRRDDLAEHVVRQPDHAGGADPVDRGEDRFDLGGIDVLAAGHDEVGSAAGHHKLAIGVEVPPVLGAEPGIGPVLVRVADVAAEQARPADLDRAVDEADLDAG
jgi:hypothetical protein